MSEINIAHEVSLEIGRRRALRKHDPEPDEVTLEDGRQLTRLEQHYYTPLLLKEAVESSQLDSEFVLRVAYDAIAFNIKLRGKVAAFLRPIVPGDPLLVAEDLLDLNDFSYDTLRDQAIRQIVRGQRKHAFLVFEQAVLAVMLPLPPRNLEGSPVVTPEEMKSVEALRWSGIPRDRLPLALRSWVEQFRSMDPEEAVTAVITIDEQLLLNAFRQAGEEARQRALEILIEGRALSGDE